MAKKKKEYKEVINVPDKVDIALKGSMVAFKGPRGELFEDIGDPQVVASLEGKNITLRSKTLSRKQKRNLRTFKANLINKIKGVLEGYTYKMKICSGHFPMAVSISGKEFIIKNFLGEKIPRAIKIKEGVSVKIEGDFVVIGGIDKERAGQVAADIEQLTRISNRDVRIFQDGIYIIEKAGKGIK